VAQAAKLKAPSSPLAGKLFDEGGEPLHVQGAAKGQRRYRYYVQVIAHNRACRVRRRLLRTRRRSEQPEPTMKILYRNREAGRSYRSCCFSEIDLVSGKVRSVGELARREGIGGRSVRRLIPLGFLAPRIIEAIAEGRQPPELTLEALTRRIDLPLLWSTQEQALGIA